jgi:5-formyltetrahydrofolate cyclo-ligase
VNTITALAKSTLRSHVKKSLKKITPDRLHAKSGRIHKRLLALKSYKQTELVLLYMATDREVQTVYLIESALADGRTVYVPRITGKELCFHLINEARKSLKPNSYGIPEPDAELPSLAWDTLTARASIIIVPGLAFDRQKNRLGRGKGYYDRFLNTLKKHTARTCTLIGICFSEQLYSALPFDRNDVPMDLVITDKEVVF